MKITLQNTTLDMLFKLKDQMNVSLNTLIFEAIQQYYNNNYKGIQNGQQNNQGKTQESVLSA